MYIVLFDYSRIRTKA